MPRKYEGTYYGKPSNAENLVCLDKNPTGGVQHVAFSTPVAKLDKVISEFADKGLTVISTFNTPIAKIVFFDTYKEIGVMTEIMGITKEGEEQVEKMKK